MSTTDGTFGSATASATIDRLQSQVSNALQNAGVDPDQADQLASSLTDSVFFAATLRAADPSEGAARAQLEEATSVTNIVDAALTTNNANLTAAASAITTQLQYLGQYVQVGTSGILGAAVVAPLPHLNTHGEIEETGASALGPGEHPVSEPCYVLTYLDVDEAAAERASALITEHAERSAKEFGNLTFEALRQVGRPNHFAILEVWIDQESRDAHATGDSTVAFRNSLQPYLYNRYQQQALAALNTADPTTLDKIKDASLLAVTHVEISACSTTQDSRSDEKASPGETLVHQLVTASRSHPGNLRFDALANKDQPDRVMLVEAWATSEHQKAHAESKDVHHFNDKMSSMTPGRGAAARELLANTSLASGVYDQRLYVRMG
ncbi:MAG: antibiotic biosynthesis monooxygenase [Pseudomonadota bacterium]